jgi:hypothetical protein
MAATPEDSDYTSIQERIKPSFDLEKAIQSQNEHQDILDFSQAFKPLFPAIYLPFLNACRLIINPGLAAPLSLKRCIDRDLVENGSTSRSITLK